MAGPLERALILLSVAWLLPVSALADSLATIEPLVRAGRDEAALLRIAEAEAGLRERPEVRYLTSRLFARLGRLEDALAALPPVEALPEDVRDDAALERALLQARLGRCAEATPVLLEHAERRGGRRAVARFRAAECAHRLGEHRRALALTEETVKTDPRGVDLLEVRRLRADAELARGRRARAVAELLAAWIERPTHPAMAEIEAKLASLPGGDRALDRAARLARVAALADGRRFTAALEALEALPPAELRRVEARRLKGRALFSLKRYDEAARLLAVTARGGDSEARRDELLAARARYRAGAQAEGLRGLRRVANRHRGTYEGDLAAYLLAEVSFDRGGTAGTRALERFLASPAAERLAREAQSARFRLGLGAFERSRAADAARHFAAYERAAADREERLAGRYWRARSLALGGELAEARELLVELAERHPFDWYGYHARRRVHAMGEAERLERALPELPEPASSGVVPRGSEAARFYTRLGLVADAEAKLRAELSDEPHERLAFHLARGDARSAFLVARADRALYAPVEGATRWIWEAAYPRPHRAHVAAMAARTGVHEAWVYATMRQESGFQADARSRSGARGLLQLMPAVAAGLAAEAGVDLSATSLFEPEVNVKLGMELMRRIGERVGGQLPLMAAAYNAGGGRLQSWLSAHGDVELDLFVERVPFVETRRYIKRVVSHYFVYRYLGGEADPFEGAIPEKVERR